ncbi:cation:proton antiporter [Pedobacter sp.]|uniref:cation:proton antiporter n=1 Tax=Pedobacter sp. TaxID=1411316 RepID=UPI003D7FF247
MFAILTTLFAISSIFSYVNARWIKLPGVIGVMLLSIFTAAITVFAGSQIPQLTKLITNLTASIDFSDTLLDSLLGFLLFASALRFDVKSLTSNLKDVIRISTVGVLISSVIFAGLFYYAAEFIGLDMPFSYCLVFGALISPTDAVAVAALLKQTKMPKRLETIINGESLFNDGSGIVLFITFLGMATKPDTSFSWQHVGMLFVHEVFGGQLFGLAFGWVALRMIRSIEDSQTTVMITFSLVMLLSLCGSLFEISIPLAVVAAGLLIGSRPLSTDRESKLSDYLNDTWKLFDELLNTILFVLLGLQMVSVSFNSMYFLAGGIAIIILLLARLLSIMLPIILYRHSLQVKYSSIFILTWGGLRGAISVALALSLPPSPYSALILTASFCIVIFSIVVQGLTLNKVVNKLV